jgi:radical SAM superfamily enzyme YgiQ (UPF0313 family)
MPAEEYQGFEQGPIRPPSEARSLLVRVMRNCPWNRCRFCGVYKETRFSRRPVDHVLRDVDAVAAFVRAFRKMEPAGRRTGADIVKAATTGEVDERALCAAWDWYQTGMKSVFLQDADPLLLPSAELLMVLERLRTHFPRIERITTYARSRSVVRMSVEELSALRAAGLDRIHIGFETGCDEILAFMDKGVTRAIHIDAGRKVKEAGMELSAYYMPGLGGRTLWRENAAGTAELMDQVDPDFIRLRSLAVLDHAPLAGDVAQGGFIKSGDLENAREILYFLKHLECTRARVVSDHILNISQGVEGKLPEDRERMLDELRRFLALDPQEQVLYRIGRRGALFACLDDLTDPDRRRRAEHVCRQLGATVSNIDDLTDWMVKRFV